MGTGDDLELYHDGNSKIQNTNDSCDLRIQSNSVEIKPNTTDHLMAKFTSGGSVDLYHNNTLKLNTTSSGVTVQNGNLALNRQDSGNEGGELVFNRASDNANQWFNDVYGNDSTAKIRWHHGGSEKFVIRTGGDAQISDGNLIVASGHGIDFSATGDGSGTDSSELFDDYEEGTFTPSYQEGSGGSNMLNNCVYNNTRGFYTKIGGCVTFSLRIQCSSHTVVGGHVKINGLPYTQGATNGKEGGAFFNYSQAVDTSNGGYRPTMHISNSSTTISFYTSHGNAYQAGAGGTNWNLTLHITGVYHTF